ncbi:5'-nucleotidase SurE-like [Ylistrum balloti]|uniref:5'-nucleotidase SurE-like n=1 Tax=Ylistrum balloti TaxID=509963 RepID=UPI0029059FD3|nr:5'-nucleotidase SurE-like [Ylistrum balloti]
MSAIILISNDDGYRANGIASLLNFVQDLGITYTIAPDQEQSSCGHALTLHRPLRVTKEGKHLWSVDGTPTDCVHLGLRSTVLPQQPKLVLTGINHGSNLGDEITYSGTVAGAMEACLLGVPSIAFSCLSAGHSRNDLEALRLWVHHIVTYVLKTGLPKGTFLNVNFPDPRRSKIEGLRVTTQGTRVYGAEVVEKSDPRERRYYWIGGDVIDQPTEPGSDVEAIESGFVSVTPLHLKLTDHKMVTALKQTNLECNHLASSLLSNNDISDSLQNLTNVIPLERP